MPANRMNAPVGSNAYVTGSSSATAIAGPMPGSTPMAVPSSTPIAENSRLAGVSAWPKPSKRWVRFSITSDQPHQRSAGQVHAEQRVEHEPGRQRDARGDQQVARERTGAERVGRAPEQHGPGDRPAEQRDQRGGRDDHA